jgi:hypothetical protein
MTILSLPADYHTIKKSTKTTVPRPQHTLRPHPFHAAARMSFTQDASVTPGGYDPRVEESQRRVNNNKRPLYPTLYRWENVGRGNGFQNSGFKITIVACLPYNGAAVTLGADHNDPNGPHADVRLNHLYSDARTKNGPIGISKIGATVTRKDDDNNKVKFVITGGNRANDSLILVRKRPWWWIHEDGKFGKRQGIFTCFDPDIRLAYPT